MHTEVLAAILLAALMNAVWNSAIKIGGDKIAVMTLTTLAGSAVSLCALPLIGIQQVHWPLLVISIGVHTIYHFVLATAYKHGELGYVYPIARGGAPLLVTIIAAVVVGELPATTQMLGILFLSAGVLTLALQHHLRGASSHGTVFALLTSGLIASYTVIDALGARQSESALGFAVLLTIGDGLATALIALVWRGQGILRPNRRMLALSAVAGCMQIGAYWIAVWALARAPMGTVSALRESSVLFVALISTCLLKERLGTHRIACSALVFAGIVLLKFSS